MFKKIFKGVIEKFYLEIIKPELIELKEALIKEIVEEIREELLKEDEPEAETTEFKN